MTFFFFLLQLTVGFKASIISLFWNVCPNIILFPPFKLRDLLISEYNYPPFRNSSPLAFLFIIPFYLFHAPSVMYVVLWCTSFTSIFSFCNPFFHLYHYHLSGWDCIQASPHPSVSIVSIVGLSAYRGIIWFVSKQGTNRRSTAFILLPSLKGEMLLDRRFNFQSKAFSCWSWSHFRLDGRDAGNKENLTLADDKLHLLTVKQGSGDKKAGCIGGIWGICSLRGIPDSEI